MKPFCRYCFPPVIIVFQALPLFKNIFNSLNDHSIGTKIKWLIFPIAILPLIVLSLTMLSVSKQALIKQLDENTQAKLIDISSHIQSTYDLSIKSLIGELNAFEYMLFQNGTPEIINNKLTLKSSDNRLVINDDNSLVEKFFGMFGNRATIFQVIGNEAIRVSTNIRLDSGKLAIGTRVSQQVFETVVNQQQQYIGFADVVGNPYLTVYSPLYNASGKVIGIIFVGIKEVELFKKMLSTLEQLEFGHSGQVFIIDENTNWIIEPDLSKRKNSVSEKEIIDEWFFRTKVGMQQPVVTETVENGHALKQWYLKIPKLNWTIVAYIYPEEFMQPINQNKDTMIAVVVFLIALIAIITHIISRRVSNKAQSLGNLAKAIKENDLTKAKVLSSNLANNNLNKDEFQIISNALNEATESLHFNQTQIIELKERYRQFFEVNSSVKLVINPETGSIVEANSAALEFYGYDHKTITTMNISDINCLTEEQITRERQSALNEQRLYFEFKHKLANGEIKEVEVYSGPVEVNGTKLLFSIVHDVSQKNFQARELEEERFRLRSIVEGTDAAIWEWDHQSQTVRLNEKWLTLLGYEMLPSQAITASAWRSRIHIKDLARFEDEYNKHLIGRSSIFNVTIRHISVSGKTLWIKHRGRFMNTASQREKVLYCASVDVTELVEKEQQALLAAEKFEAIANATMAGVLSLDKDCKVTYINEQFTRMFGFDFESLTDLDNWIVTVTKKEKDRMILSNLTKQGVNQQSFEINMLSSDGQLKDIMLSIVKSQYSVVATFVDITEQKKRENTIQYVANHDTLTGLYNRVSFTKHLNLGLKQSSANNNMVCILFIDLDGFKKINDTYGHDAGDKVLQIVANRMAADVRIERGDDVVARLGGDEFTAMLVNVKNKFYCEQIIQRILHSIDEPIMFNEASLHVTSSIGAVIIEPNSDLDSDAILRQADHAMYQAKRAGKNRFVWFEKEGFEDLEQSSEVSNVYEIKSSK